MLYPQSNAKRSVLNLNGIWNFSRAGDDYDPRVVCAGQPMPVPASCNDITADKSLRDYVGKVVYEREFSLPVLPATWTFKPFRPERSRRTDGRPSISIFSILRAFTATCWCIPCPKNPSAISA